MSDTKTETPNFYIELQKPPTFVVGQVVSIHGVIVKVTSITPYQDGPREPSMWAVTGVSPMSKDVYIPLKGQ